MNSKDLFDFARKIAVFSICSDATLEELLENARLLPLKPGEVVFSQGDPGDTFFLVYSGRVRIVTRGDDEREINLGVRVSGEHFGETALLTSNPRNATARAAEESVLLAIDAEAFQKHLASNPELRDYFEKFISFTSIHSFLKSCTDLSAIPPRELRELVKRFQSRFFKEGDVVIRQGEAPDKFYLIESGKVRVVRHENGQEETINFLHAGEFFGEKALIEDSPRHADVVCLTDCHVFSLSRKDFHELFESSPKLRKVFEERVRSYLGSEGPPIPYTEMIKQELGAHTEIVVEKPGGPEPDAAREKQETKSRPSFYRQHIRFPFIRQHDEMSCGTTCIMMIARYYGKEFSSARIRELAHVDTSGSSLANLAKAAEKLGFATRGMSLDYETLASISLPCIVHWQGYHYICVYRITDTHVWVSDPALGLRKYTREFFEENWKGITLICEPTPEFDTQEENKTAIRNFLQFVIPYKTVLLEILAASMLLNIFGLATPIFTQNVIDKVLTHSNVTMLNMMLVGMLLVLVFRILTMIVRQYLIIHTSMKIDLRMLVFFYKHLLALPLGYFRVRKVGDFMTRFGENMRIRNFLTNTALTLVLDAILIVVYLCLMFYYNVQMTFLVIVFVPVFVLMTLIFTPILKRLNIDSFAARAESQSHLIESINGIEAIKASNIEYQTRWKWENKFIKSLNLDFKLYNNAMYFSSIADFVGTLSSTVILWYGANKVMNSQITVGELMAFMALTGSVITPINRIITAWDDIQQTIVSIDRLNDVFSAEPELPTTGKESTGLMVSEPRGEIEFRDVYFRYGGEDDPYILAGINLKIQPGNTVAIVGRSGSGKTTLVKLIARFYDVSEGRILLDGCDIKTLDLSCLRGTVGFVLQDTFIFDSTIRENISLDDPEETMEKVIEAARLANAHDFISGLALGYETKVGESGLQLSGGQKQRIAIARALYHKPRVIIFDEATSSLDTESEQAIQKNMNMILKNKTAIIIAHRLSTVRNADLIVVLDNGEIVEQGSHEELMARKGLYHYLNYQQLGL